MKNSRSIIHEGKTYSWMKQLTMVAHDAGLPGGSVSGKKLAAMVCQKNGWVLQDWREVIVRRATQMLDDGVYVKRCGGRRLRQKEDRSHRAHSAKPRLAPPGHSIGAPHPDYRRDDGFYKSQEWRQIRLLALQNCRCCQACGARPPDVVLHVDHVIPRYKAPHLSLELSNLQVLCEDCNIGKGAWSMADFRQHFRSI